MNSIMQTEKECYLCREAMNNAGFHVELPAFGLHKHHVIFGTANRKKADKFGLWVYVCAERHHEYGPEAPHVNRKVAEFLIRRGQRAFEQEYSHERWMEEFGKNYL